MLCNALRKLIIVEFIFGVGIFFYNERGGMIATKDACVYIKFAIVGLLLSFSYGIVSSIRRL